MPEDSSMGSPSLEPFRLDEWMVEPSANTVSRGAERVRVPPRVMEVLLCLVAGHGRVVSQRELIDSVWQEQFVSVAALTRCIAILRKILGDEAAQPRYVENIPRRGYRLVIRPEPLTEPPSDPPPEASMCRLRFGKREFVLVEGANAIGRAVDAAVRIDSSKVSRHHAQVAVSGSHATIEDLGSKNGTFVAGHRIDSVCVLEDRDQITIGPAVLVFLAHNPDRPTETLTDR